MKPGTCGLVWNKNKQVFSSIHWLLVRLTTERNLKSPWWPSVRTEVTNKYLIRVSCGIRVNVLEKDQIIPNVHIVLPNLTLTILLLRVVRHKMSRIILSYVNNPRRHFHLRTAWSNSSFSSSPCGHRSPNSEISIPLKYSTSQSYCLENIL